MAIFGRFTQRAQRAVTYAQQAAVTLHQSYVGTEHLILGILMEHEGIGARILEKRGINEKKLRDAVIAMNEAES